MNKNAFVMLNASAALVQAAGSLWPVPFDEINGFNDIARVSSDGNLYKQDDSEEGGSSETTWFGDYDEVEEPQLRDDGGLPILLNLQAGADKPIAKLGVDFDANVPDVRKDYSGKEGFCLTYGATSEVRFGLRSPALTDGSSFSATLPKAMKSQVLNVEWKDFIQTPGEAGGASVPLEEVTKALSGLDVEPTKLNDPLIFVLYQLGFAGECDGGGKQLEQFTSGVSIYDPATDSFILKEFKVVLHERSLSISGLENHVLPVRVMNLQGQVVSQARLHAAQSTLDLSHLESGLYSVSVEGRGSVVTRRFVLR